MMAEWAVQRSDLLGDDPPPRVENGAFSAHSRAAAWPLPGGLLPRACHALPWGILVISARGLVTYYNQAYARIRHIAPGALLGHPVQVLDRRQQLGEILRTGVLPQPSAVADERRRNRETILPLWEEELLVGVVVIVQPAFADPDTALVTPARSATPRPGVKKPLGREGLSARLDHPRRSGS